MIFIEGLGEVPPYFGIGLQIVASIILGGLVGIDREINLKSAGIKTNILICLGATLYTTISLMIQQDYGGPNTDPNRIAAQIVSGIGFLGAGAIIQGRGNNVVGLTTAATIWVVAAIGVTIGAGHPVKAGLFTITLLLVLRVIRPLYKLIQSERSYHLEVMARGSVKKQIQKILESEGIMAESFSEEMIDPEKKRRIIKTEITVHPKFLNNIIIEINDLLQVEKTNYYIVDNDH